MTLRSYQATGKCLSWRFNLPSQRPNKRPDSSKKWTLVLFDVHSLARFAQADVSLVRELFYDQGGSYMRRFTQSLALLFSISLGLPAMATPHDALINNALSMPAEINKAVIIESDLTETRGQLWPFIFGVVAVDLALQAYVYGVYIPATDGE
jgi:hypothetical protein